MSFNSQPPVGSMGTVNSNQDVDMEEENTQPATQPIVDPRCVGGNGLGLNDEEVADIICILHPTSADANTAVKLTKEYTPQHIVTKPVPRKQQVPHFEYNSEQEISESEGDDATQPIAQTPTVDVAANDQCDRMLGADIALKFSSQAKMPKLGFLFGRGRRCDILITDQTEVKRVSNVHFRIFLNSQGILMLEDLSTNGTLVDAQHLGRKSTTGDTQRMLVNSSIISVLCGPGGSEIRFIVRLPMRTQDIEIIYKNNLSLYLTRCAEEEMAKACRGKKPVLNRHGQQMTPATTRAAALSAFHQPTPFGPWNGGEKYNILGEIGKGSFATVYKIATKSNGDVFAAKQLSKNGLAKGATPGRVENEIDIIKEMNHPNIVRYIECYTLDEHIIIVMEYMEYGDLTGYLNKHGALSEPMAQEVARQILRGLEYVHKKKVTHRDIKPDNILIQSLDPIVVKLSDFGLSKRVDDSTFLKTFCGTLLYCAPEVYHERTSENIPHRSLGDRYGQSADMWSFGAVLFVLLCNRPPFAGKEQPRLMLDFITTQPVDVRPLRECGVSVRGITFVKRLLNVRSDLRPTETECLKDPWLNDGADLANDTEMADTEHIRQEEGGDEDAEGDLGASSQVSQLRLSPRVEDRVIADSIEEESHEFDDVKRRDFAVAAHPQPEASSSVWSSDGLQMYNNIVPRHTAGRLFGEISGSVARSSEIFGLPNRDQQGNGASDQFDLELPNTEHQNVSSRQSQNRPRETRAVQSSPSLQGAESLVNQLQMAGSPSSGNSLVLTPGSPRTPTTPKSRMATPTSIGPRPRDEDPVEATEPTPKRQKFDRQIRLIPPTPTSRGVSASETRLIAQKKSDGKVPGLAEANTNHESEERNDGPPQEPIAGREEQGVVASADALQTSIGSLARGQAAEASENTEHQNAVDAQTTGFIPAAVGTTATSVTSPGEGGFVRPLPVWGKLVPKPGSDPNISLSLTRDITSYGRSELSSFVISPEKVLVSRRHLIIQLFKPGLTSEDIKAAGKTWMDYPDMMPILKVLSSRGMWINDRRIKQNQYARIYNGDELTVYAEPFRPRIPGAFLTFVCEFYHGNWTQRRPGYPLFQNGEMDNFAEDGRVQFPDLWEAEPNSNLAATMIPHELAGGSTGGVPQT
ncbi:MAG: hypothetical protein M1839_009480 [Geoglossum umbratile]|nr:MAG: hypothetical protein M1839_009480 [Geoglossum umbratile]